MPQTQVAFGIILIHFASWFDNLRLVRSKSDTLGPTIRESWGIQFDHLRLHWRGWRWSRSNVGRWRGHVIHQSSIGDSTCQVWRISASSDWMNQMLTCNWQKNCWDFLCKPCAVLYVSSLLSCRGRFVQWEQQTRMVILDNDCQSKFREHFVRSWGLGGPKWRGSTLELFCRRGKTAASGIFRSNWLCSHVWTKE